MGLLRMSCFNRQGEVKADDAKYTGTEPTWEDVGNMTEEQINFKVRGAFNFYAYYCEDCKND